MNRSGLLCIIGLMAMLPLQSHAQSAGNLPADTKPRFTFTPVEGGALRMDTQTGRVTLCAKTVGTFTCEAVPDTRDAYEAEIARLQDEIAALRLQAPGRIDPPAPSAALPAEVERALGYAESLYRRLKGLIDELRSLPSEQL